LEESDKYAIRGRRKALARLQQLRCNSMKLRRNRP
jgi:hypothetical protein